MQTEIELKSEESYAVSVEELRVVASHWMTFLLDEQFFYCSSQQYSSSDEAKKLDALRRLNDIETVIGKEELDKLWDKSREAFRKSIGQELWRILTDSTREERDLFVADHASQSNEFRKKFYSDTLADQAFARLQRDVSTPYTDVEGDTWFLGTGPFTPHDRLSLAIYTQAGEMGFDGSRSVERPAGWIPFGPSKAGD